MIGWFAARSDGPQYGNLVVYKYPKDQLVFGPLQVEALIDQQPPISSQFALWNQSGARVIRGNLLVIPIGQSNLYIEPIYLQAKESPLPELTRVILVTGRRIVMEPTLEEALNKLFGAAAPSTAPPTPSVSAPPGPAAARSVAQLAAEAQDRYRRAQEALRAGDFARYGDEIRQLEETLNQLARAAQSSP